MEKQKKEYKEIELRSEEVQEVMSTIPIWIVRWGILVIFSIIFLLLIGSYWFKYPDTVEADILISTRTPPAFVLAKENGRIDTLCVTNGSKAKKGQVIAVIENEARTEDILKLKQQMELWKKSGYNIEKGETYFQAPLFQLGDIQPAFAAFFSAFNNYANFLKLNYYSQKKIFNLKQIRMQKKHFQLTQYQYNISHKEQEVVDRIYGRDSTLYYRNVMIAAEFDVSKRNYLQSLQTRVSDKMSLNQIAMQIEQNKENLLDVNRQSLTEEQKYQIDLKNAVEQLRSQLISWERKYLLIAPIDGTVTFMSIWSKFQNVSSNETVFVIAPLIASNPIGKALLPIPRSGKVKLKQQVHIRLNNYPDQEFGYLKGMVSSVSPVPTAEGMYIVGIELSNGLKTTYGKTLPISREMKGQAEIITEDMRLIERLLAPLRKIIDKGRY